MANKHPIEIENVTINQINVITKIRCRNSVQRRTYNSHYAHFNEIYFWREKKNDITLNKWKCKSVRCMLVCLM